MNTKNSKENLALKLAKDNIEVEQVKPLHIEYVKVDDIYPNDYNPNTHDADRKVHTSTSSSQTSSQAVVSLLQRISSLFLWSCTLFLRRCW